MNGGGREDYTSLLGEMEIARAGALSALLARHTVGFFKYPAQLVEKSYTAVIKDPEN